MKSNFKKVMSILLTVLMVLTAVPFATFAAEECEHNFCGEVFDRVEGKHAYWCIECNMVYGYIDDDGNQIQGLVDCSGSEATCSEAAFCYGCNRYFGDYDYDNHLFNVKDKKHLASAATCQEAATYYYSCEYCGNGAWDEEYTYKSGTADIVNGHIGYDDGVKSNGDGTHHIDYCYLCESEDLDVVCSGGYANCQNKAECDFCGEEYGEVNTEIHTETAWKNAEEATCQAPGHNGYNYCVDCKAETSEKEVVPQLDHTYPEKFTKDEGADTHSKTCTTCDETRGEVSVITETCTGGTANCTTKATCEVCGSAYGDVQHAWNDGEVTTAPTCSATGVKTYTCTVETCGVTKTETLAIVEDAHAWGTELHKDADQKHYVVCENDNCEEKNYSDCTAMTTVVTAPTCEEDGFTTYTCACGNTWTGEPTTKTGHACTVRDTEANICKTPATCQTKGEYYYACANCGTSARDIESCTVKTYKTDELEHVWDDGVITKAATCMEAGEKKLTCTTCPEGTEAATKTEPIAINPDAHAWSEWAETAEDKHERVCAHNNVHKETEDCGGGEATCTAKAECSVCGDEYGEIAPHAYTQKITDEAHKISAATCIAKATYWYDCENCDANAKLADKAGMTEEAIAALKYEDGDFAAHNYTKKCEDEAHIAKEATCTTDAFYWFGCAQEGCTANAKDDAEAKDKFYRAENTKTGHKTVIIEGKAPTCEEKGYTESIKCEKCGEFTKEAVERPATGHKEVIVQEKIEATCERDGRTEEKECGVCGKKLASSKVIPALGHINKDGDDICDRLSCQAVVDGGIQECHCICHQSGFMRVLYIFVKLFWKLFGTSPICDCGIAHY